MRSRHVLGRQARLGSWSCPRRDRSPEGHRLAGGCSRHGRGTRVRRCPRRTVGSSRRWTAPPSVSSPPCTLTSSAWRRRTVVGQPVTDVLGYTFVRASVPARAPSHMPVTFAPGRRMLTAPLAPVPAVPCRAGVSPRSSTADAPCCRSCSRRCPFARTLPVAHARRIVRCDTHAVTGVTTCRSGVHSGRSRARRDSLQRDAAWTWAAEHVRRCTGFLSCLGATHRGCVSNMRRARACPSRLGNSDAGLTFMRQRSSTAS